MGCGPEPPVAPAGGPGPQGGAGPVLRGDGSGHGRFGGDGEGERVSGTQEAANRGDGAMSSKAKAREQAATEAEPDVQEWRGGAGGPAGPAAAARPAGG